MANEVVHIDIAKNLIELILDVQHLTEMVLYLGIKLEVILDKKRSWKATLGAATSHFNFQLPLETHKTLCELETNLDKNPVLAPKLKAVLSLVGSNKDQPQTGRNLRVGVEQKPTNAMHGEKGNKRQTYVFTKHKLISNLVLR